MRLRVLISVCTDKIEELYPMECDGASRFGGRIEPNGGTCGLNNLEANSLHCLETGKSKVNQVCRYAKMGKTDTFKVSPPDLSFLLVSIS
jgi:hypothetical protein